MRKLMMLQTLMILLIFCSCTSVPPHKIAFLIKPRKNMLCQQTDIKGKKLKEEKCFDINYKDSFGQYKFLQYGGYIAISMQAIKETLHAAQK